MQSPVPTELEEPLSYIDSDTADPNANPGYDLFNSDSEDDHLSYPDEILLPSSDSEEEPVLRNTNIIHPGNPLIPVIPNRGILNPTSNWLQSSSDDDNDLGIDQSNSNLLQLPNRTESHSVTNWLQSSPDNGSDIDQDQFLLNANDIFSDDAWSSYNESDTGGNNEIFEPKMFCPKNQFKGLPY